MAVPTLVHIDGFEYGLATFSVSGSGIATTVTDAGGVIKCDSAVKRSGDFSLKIAADGVNIARIIKNLLASQTMLVGAFYFRQAVAPATASLIATSASAQAQFRVDTAGTLSALYASGTAQTTAGSVCDDAWHLIDFKADVDSNPLTLDWRVDGVAQTQATRPISASTISTWQWGASLSTANGTFWIDDVVFSNTEADYPIGSTSVPHHVYAVKPTGDGTHNAGTNTIEDNAGTDIVSPNAFPLVDNWPPDTAAYIRQATIDTGKYAEVTFANHDAGIGTIWDAQAMVAFTSSTNAVNEGAAVVSADAFSTTVEIYGTPAARTNYQTSSSTNTAYKVGNVSTSQGVITRPAGDWTTTNFDALTARVGYSGDVTGNPRWHGLLIQYAGTGAGISSGETTFVGVIPI